jgi:hypothetical protein
LKEDLALSWDQHNLETLNLLLAVNAKFPKTVKGFLQENLGCQSLGDSVCFDDLAAFLMVMLAISFHIYQSLKLQWFSTFQYRKILPLILIPSWLE